MFSSVLFSVLFPFIAVASLVLCVVVIKLGFDMWATGIVVRRKPLSKDMTQKDHRHNSANAKFFFESGFTLLVLGLVLAAVPHFLVWRYLSNSFSLHVVLAAIDLMVLTKVLPECLEKLDDPQASFEKLQRIQQRRRHIAK